MNRNVLDGFKEAYNRKFKFYDEDILMAIWCGQRMVETITEKGFKSVISLGVGHKVVSRSILRNLSDILTKFIIIEGSSKMIKDFRRTINLPPNVRLVKSLFEEFETEEKFDAIEMGFVLEHVDHPLSILKRYSTFLKAGGSILISVPNARSLHRLIGCEAGLLDDLYRLSPFDLRLGHKRYFDLKSLERLVHKSGLKIAKREGIYLKPFSTSQLKSLHLSPEVTQSLFSIGVSYPEIGNAIYLEVTR